MIAKSRSFGRRCRQLVLLIGGVLLVAAAFRPLRAAPAQPQATATITAAADAFVAGKQPGTRFGKEFSLRIGYEPSFGDLQTLVYFDLGGGLPSGPGVSIEEAHVELVIASASPAFDSPLPTDLYRVAGPWSEALVTWGNRPPLGERVATTDVEWHPQVVRWNVTNLVREWTSGSRPNHGVLLTASASASSARSRTGYARENGVAANSPRLIVRYTIDSTPPTAAVKPLPTYSPKEFAVAWEGSDSGGSGIAYFDLQFRADGGSWQNWKSQVTGTSAVFNGQAGVFYEFRARAVDRAGNAQTFGGVQASTYAGFATAAVLPFTEPVLTKAAFPIVWQSDTHGGAPITKYFIYVSYNGGSYAIVPNMDGIAAVSAEFTAAQGDGLYAFQALAENGDGVRESLTSQSEASILVDAEAPFIQPRSWLPITPRSSG